MLRRFSIDFAIFSMLVDFGLVMLALKIASMLRPWIGKEFSFAQPFNVSPSIEWYLYPLFGVIWVMLLLLFSVYDGRRNFRFIEETSSLFNASMLATVALAGFLYLSFREYSRVLFLSFAALNFGLQLAARIAYRIVFRLRRSQDAAVRRVLILGAGPVGKKISEQVQSFAHNGVKLVGFLDDDPLKWKTPHVLGTISQAVEIARREQIDDIILALPSRVWTQISALVGALHEQPLRLWVAPDYYALALNKARVEELAGIPLIDLRAPALNDYQRMTKRIFDLVITLLMMPFLLPALGLIALCIKFDSPGPIIFRQTRAGENGRLFKMFKFRTMVDGADRMRYVIEQVDAHGRILQDKRKADPRITRIGHFLRRTSLDELPQFFNVLLGDMSLVGPRPEMPHLVEQYEPWQRRRFSVPQGITGWWQVNGRSDKPMHLNTEDDLYYVANYSISLDIQIILKTVVAVFRRKGAY